MNLNPALHAPHDPRPGGSPLAPYPSRNIRLSSALWAMQFLPRIKEEPATVVVDFETKQPVVTFWHEQTMPPEAPVAISFAKLDKVLGAGHVGLWWAEPKKYSIEGYDDALQAMRRVHETREWLIGAIKGKHRVAGDGRRQAKSVTTESLHIASIILACDCQLLAFDRRTFVFSNKAAPIAALIHEASEDGRARSPSAPNPQRATAVTFGRDLCVDWMLASLACAIDSKDLSINAWLALPSPMVRDPDR
jgi:hypothetical protein